MAKKQEAGSAGEKRWDAQAGHWVAWSGRAWLHAPYSVDPGRLRSPVPLDEDPPVASEARERLLNNLIIQQLTSSNAVVRHRTTDTVVFGSPKPVPHLLFALVTLLTVGIGAILWFVVLLDRTEERFTVRVDAHGHAWVVG